MTEPCPKCQRDEHLTVTCVCQSPEAAARSKSLYAIPLLLVLLVAAIAVITFRGTFSRGPVAPEVTQEEVPVPTAGPVLTTSAGEEFSEPESEPLQEAEVNDQDQEDTPGWQYDSDSDGAELATLLSNNSIQVGDDSGPMQQAVLQLREHPGHGKDAIFYVPGASASCSTRCSLHVRFSAGKVKDFTAYAGEEDGQALLIIRDYGVFLPLLKRSAVVQIDAEMEGHAPETMSFSVEGLSWR